MARKRGSRSSGAVAFFVFSIVMSGFLVLFLVLFGLVGSQDAAVGFMPTETNLSVGEEPTATELPDVPAYSTEAPLPLEPRDPALLQRPAASRQPSATQGTAAVAHKAMEKKRTMVVPEKRPPKKVRGRLVVVIDDVGHNMDQLEYFLRIPVPVTYAVLPGLRHTRQSANLLRLKGREVILHQPMEAEGDYDEGPGVILASVAKDQNWQQVQGNFGQLVHAVGANNHMGSKGTQDPEVLEVLMKYLSSQGMFFLDSRTSPATVGRKIATRWKVPYMERDVFLDNSSNPAAIRKALMEGVAIADTKGYAIMIGHVWTKELADVLMEEYKPLLDQGFAFDTLANLVFLNRMVVQ